MTFRLIEQTRSLEVSKGDNLTVYLTIQSVDTWTPCRVYGTVVSSRCHPYTQIMSLALVTTFLFIRNMHVVSLNVTVQIESVDEHRMCR